MIEITDNMEKTIREKAEESLQGSPKLTKEEEALYALAVKNSEIVFARNILHYSHENKNLYPDKEVKPEAKDLLDSLPDSEIKDEKLYYDISSGSKYNMSHQDIFNSLLDIDSSLLSFGDRLINQYGVNPQDVRNTVIQLIDRLYTIRTALNRQHFEKYESKDEVTK